MEIIESNLQKDADTSPVCGRQKKMFVNFDKTDFMIQVTRQRLNK